MTLLASEGEEHFEITHYLDIYDFYYLWCITYPTKDTDKEKQKLPPILLIPRLIILENECSNQDKLDNTSLNDLETIEHELSELNLNDAINLRILKLPANKNYKTLPLETIKDRLLKLSNHLFTPVLFSAEILNTDSSQKGNSELLPLPIRETDFDYQVNFTIQFM